MNLSGSLGRRREQITIRLDPESIQYFKKMAEETGISYQNLIDLYLKDCARGQRRLLIKWLKAGWGFA